jgi:hypothetical protein
MVIAATLHSLVPLSVLAKSLPSRYALRLEGAHRRHLSPPGHLRCVEMPLATIILAATVAATAWWAPRLLHLARCILLHSCKLAPGTAPDLIVRVTNGSRAGRPGRGGHDDQRLGELAPWTWVTEASYARGSGHASGPPGLSPMASGRIRPNTVFCFKSYYPFIHSRKCFKLSKFIEICRKLRKT